MAMPKTDPSAKRVSFSLKTEQEVGEKPSSLSIVETDNSEKKSASQTKLKTKGRENRFFYKVSNHQELFRIGRSFYDDYTAGVKSFAISSTGYQTSQQKTILGLASFFDHKDDYKIAVISDNLDQGAFKDIVSISKNIPSTIVGDDYSLNVKSFYNHFDFINLDEVLNLSNHHNMKEYDSVFDHIVDYYDIVFWDVPELHKIQLDSERYFPMIMKFESLSIIVSKQITKERHVDELKQFFLGYGINMKGLLFEEKNSFEKKPKNSKAGPIKKLSWWQRIFK